MMRLAMKRSYKTFSCKLLALDLPQKYCISSFGEIFCKISKRKVGQKATSAEKMSPDK